MSHPAQVKFVKSVKHNYPEFFKSKKVLEVGSLNINGTVRTFFEDCDYTGLDVAEGEAVDIVCQGQDYDAPDNTFDVSISCECFEHNPEWVSTFKNMHRVTRVGGLVVITCATTGRPEHGTTRVNPGCSPLTVSIGWEYYKNLTSKDFSDNFDLDNMFKSFCFANDHQANDLYFFGFVS